MRKILAVLIVLACFVPLVSADAFSAWSAYGDAWKATNDTYTLVMWNATGAHTWLANGNATTVEYLVVGGGGSGGNASDTYAAGGGGGGVLSGTIATTGSIAITVGAGGAATSGSKGGNSSFDTIEANGGGYGAASGVNKGGDGGSGGGTCDASAIWGNGTVGQGYNGSASMGGNSCGSGGGAGEKGRAGSANNGGPGGNGTASAITGTSTYYGGGGGGPGITTGGSGGLGGGGNGGKNTVAATAGTNGLGGGGGGPWGVGGIKAGGSGVVIISYLTSGEAPLVANFTSSSNPSAANTVVTFTDTSTGTPTTYNWTIDGSVTNTTQDAAYLFDTIGTYSVDLNVTNASGHFSNYTLNQVVANVSGFTQQDIWMEGQYLQTFHIVDSNNLPIANVTITSTSGNSFTTSNGTGYLTEPFGAATVTFVSNGYNSRAIAYVFDSDDTHSVTMYTATPPASSNVNTLYSPQTVHLTIVDAYGVPQPGAYITVSYIASSLPSSDTNWLTANFGVDEDVAADMVNSSVLQRDYTGSDGGFVFTAFPVIRYNITAVNATTGMNHRTEITPKDSHYVIYCPLSGQTRGNNTLIARQNATLPWYSLNNTHIMLGMTYQDTTSCTSSVRFRAWFQTNGSEIHNTTWSGFGSALILDNHTILKAPIGTEYLWQYNATRVC